MEPYRVVRSKRKTMSLEVRRDLTVLVRAPLSYSDEVIAHFVEKNTGWIEKNMEKRRRYMEAYPEPSDEELSDLADAARAYLPSRVRFFSERMGLFPAGVRISAARTRFGSCSGKNVLSFSCRLMRFPPEAIDYVVVHELSHIVHKNHGKHFYECIASVLPDYRERRAMLKPR